MGILIFIGISGGLALLDIVCKSTIEGYMTKKEERTAFGGKLILRKVYNRGMFLELGREDPQLVKYLTTLLSAGLTLLQFGTLLKKGNLLKKTGRSLQVAGAWSNTLDRWMRGYVIDYIGFQTKPEKTTKLTYNIGDFCIAAGTIITAIAKILPRSKGAK